MSVVYQLLGMLVGLKTPAPEIGSEYWLLPQHSGSF